MNTIRTTIEREHRTVRGDDVMVEIAIDVEYGFADGILFLGEAFDIETGVEIELTMDEAKRIETEAWQDNAKNAIDVSGQAMEDAS